MSKFYIYVFVKLMLISNYIKWFKTKLNKKGVNYHINERFILFQIVHNGAALCG